MDKLSLLKYYKQLRLANASAQRGGKLRDPPSKPGLQLSGLPIQQILERALHFRSKRQSANPFASPCSIGLQITLFKQMHLNILKSE